MLVIMFISPQNGKGRVSELRYSALVVYKANFTGGKRIENGIAGREETRQGIEASCL